MPEAIQGKPEPKISLPEIIIIGFFFIALDLVGIILLFFALDDFWITDLISAAIFLYLFIKGVPPMRQFICWLLELFPWVGALPLLTIGWGLTVWADHHPSSALAKAGAVASVARGRGVVGSAKMGKLGAQSLKTMERAEEHTKRWQGKLRRGGGEEKGGEGVEAEKKVSEKPSEGERKLEIPKGALGEQPSEFEKLQKLTEEPLTEEKKNTDTIGRDRPKLVKGTRGSGAGEVVKEGSEKLGKAIKKGSEKLGEGIEKAGEAMGEVPYVGPALQVGGEVVGKGVKFGGKIAGKTVDLGGKAAGKGVDIASKGAELAPHVIPEKGEPEETG